MLEPSNQPGCRSLQRKRTSRGTGWKMFLRQPCCEATARLGIIAGLIPSRTSLLRQLRLISRPNQASQNGNTHMSSTMSHTSILSQVFLSFPKQDTKQDLPIDRRHRYESL